MWLIAELTSVKTWSQARPFQWYTPPSNVPTYTSSSAVPHTHVMIGLMPCLRMSGSRVAVQRVSAPVWSDSVSSFRGAHLTLAVVHMLPSELPTHSEPVEDDHMFLSWLFVLRSQTNWPWRLTGDRRICPTAWAASVSQYTSSTVYTFSPETVAATISRTFVGPVPCGMPPHFPLESDWWRPRF